MGETETSLDRIPRDRFWPLPVVRARAGTGRRTGVEIEFSDLTEREAASVIERLWGGTVDQRAPHEIEVDQTRFGTVKIELDTAWKDKAEGQVAEKLLDLSREVVPVEVVTPPLSEEDIPEVQRLMQALSEAGATGSEDGVLLAFGIHLNPEVAAETADYIVPVVRAFALLEPWLRAADPPDLSRRILPFIDPWPRAFVDRAAAEGGAWRLPELCDAYLELVRSRNHGLDLLPLLEHLFPDRVAAALPEGRAKGGRPTWHYRLPETGLGAEGWSFAYEWNRWVLVERVAADPALVRALSEAWEENRTVVPALGPDWAPIVQRLLEGAEIWHG